jgi:sterol desaturase/sphingolipid hydroxylase (fatty acid hydroxylase superfamily)
LIGFISPSNKMAESFRSIIRKCFSYAADTLLYGVISSFIIVTFLTGLTVLTEIILPTSQLKYTPHRPQISPGAYVFVWIVVFFLCIGSLIFFAILDFLYDLNWSKYYGTILLSFFLKV